MHDQARMPYPSIRSWRQWLRACLATAFLIPIGTIVAGLISYLLIGDARAEQHPLLFSSLLLIVAGSLIGLGQYALLPQSPSEPLLFWSSVSGICALMGGGIGLLVSAFTHHLTSGGFVLGSSIGLGQWLILRSTQRGTGIWIVLQGLTWGMWALVWQYYGGG
jgi:hypothetical protein